MLTIKKDFTLFFFSHQMQINRNISDSDGNYAGKMSQCLKYLSVVEESLFSLVISPKLSKCWNYFSTILEVITCKFIEQFWWVQLTLSTNYFYINTRQYAFISPKGNIIKCNSSILPWFKHFSSLCTNTHFIKNQQKKLVD